MTEWISRVYRFGLLAPTVNAEIVDQQMRLGHRYQNDLVQLERQRREQVESAFRLDPEVARLTDAVAVADAQLEALREGIQSERTGVRKKDQAPTITEETKALRSELKALRAELRAARKVAQKRPEVIATLAEVKASASKASRDLRAHYSKELGSYWGTRSVIEYAADQARSSITPPSFKRWDGGGVVAVQLQSQGETIGLDLGSACSGNDTRVRMLLDPVPVPRIRPLPAGVNPKPLARLQLRVASDGRDPVWAEWPMVYHRPIPAEARIMWVKVVRERVASSQRWSVHVTVRLPASWISEPCGDGAVAVDLRWRRDAGLQVCDWLGEDGEGGAEALDLRMAEGFAKVADLRSIRDRNLDATKASLKTIIGMLAHKLPEEHRERIAHMHAWRSPMKFAALAIWWRENRFALDEPIFSALEAWRQRDKHLWQYEAGLRRGLLARRRDIYRNIGARLARRYGVLVVEKMNLAKIAEVPAPENDEAYRDRSDVAHSQRFVASPSELRSALINAFRSRGGVVVEVSASTSAEEILGRYREGQADTKEPGGSRERKFERVKRMQAEAAAVA